jgi:D-arabinose 1-dehydrogenase-like Zn-dependent alcohol dehydrogenase
LSRRRPGASPIEAGIPIELAPLEAVNDVCRRLRAGEIAGRAVLTPAA